MNDMDHLTLGNVYKLFFTNQIKNVIPLTPGTPIYQHVDNRELTPMTKQIYDRLSDDEKVIFLRAIDEDNQYVAKLESQDPDYIDMYNNQQLGFYLENFISVYGHCPICKNKTLCKYASMNMPVVDLICTNTEAHFNKETNTVSCFLFQIKMKTNSNYFTESTITVGSKFSGYLSHTTKGNDDLQKKIITIGYICLKVDKLNDHQYKINNQESYVLIPNYDNFENKYYYEYLNVKPIFRGKNTIKWNNNVGKYDISSCLENYLFDTQNPYIDTDNINNPYSENLIIKDVLYEHLKDTRKKLFT